MRVNGFRCDTCCKEHLVEAYRILQYHGEGLPAEWFIVSQGHLRPDQEPLLFCSVECLAQWAEKQVIAAHKEIAEHAHTPRNWLPGDKE